MKGNTTILLALGALVIIIGALFAIPKIKKGSISTTVPCLLPNLPLAIHIHPELYIEINGVSQTVPANIGLNDVCERAIHTHDSTGQIHVEAQVQREYILKDFYDVWGEKVQKEGYDLVMTVDDATSTEYENLLLKDKQKIKLVYTKKE